MPGERLLPCPFCGSIPASGWPGETVCRTIRCIMYGFWVNIDRWNRRAIPVEESQHVNRQAEPNMPELASGESA